MRVVPERDAIGVAVTWRETGSDLPRVHVATSGTDALVRLVPLAGVVLIEGTLKIIDRIITNQLFKEFPKLTTTVLALKLFSNMSRVLRKLSIMQVRKVSSQISL
ncbi:hypothetical protein DPMN_034643 [Dreissena polymorpha]|uniref:Uncharacterized protein n=1 Tax=Dreissena polymorpha TaxID=45954 RepID=A0A9D4RJY0_DREPO|nr:hypothetical protein DPMN_034643 [Dreissena polymorpha]